MTATKATIKRTLNRWRGHVHQRLFTATSGRLGGTLGGMPVLKLTTRGRRSGCSHSVMVNTPVQRDGRFLVVGSNGGDDRDPDWLRNLRVTPVVEVLSSAAQANGSRQMTAHILSDEERDEVWPEVVATNDVFASYQGKASRSIPLVWLEPT